MQASKITNVWRRKRISKKKFECKFAKLHSLEKIENFPNEVWMQVYRIQILDKTNQKKLQNLRSLCSMLSNLKKRNLFSCWFLFESWESGDRKCMEESILLSGQIDTFGNNFLFFLKFKIQVGWWTCQLSANVQIDWCCGWCFWCSHFEVFILKRPRDTLWFGIAHHEEDGELEHEIFLYPKRCIIHGIDIGLRIVKDLQNIVSCGWLGCLAYFSKFTLWLAPLIMSLIC